MRAESRERASAASGERGIRTPGRVSPSHDFQSCPFSRSGTSPGKSRDRLACRRRYRRRRAGVRMAGGGRRGRGGRRDRAQRDDAARRPGDRAGAGARARTTSRRRRSSAGRTSGGRTPGSALAALATQFALLVALTRGRRSACGDGAGGTAALAGAAIAAGHERRHAAVHDRAPDPLARRRPEHAHLGRLGVGLAAVGHDQRGADGPAGDGAAVADAQAAAGLVGPRQRRW